MSSEPQHHQEEHGRHPTFKQYVVVATFLFVITIFEFLLIFPQGFRGSSVVVLPLIILSAIKFAIVIMFYMHLKFDAKLFTWVFLGGLFLGASVLVAMLFLFDSFRPEPRDFAEAVAVPFAEHETEGGPPGGEPPSGPPGIPELTTEPPGGQIPSGTVPAEPGSRNGELAAQGQAVFTGKGTCSACHTIEGISTGTLGPNLTHIGAVAAERKPGLSAEEYIRESIENPGAFTVEGFPPAMPPNIRGNMTDAEFESVVQFLLAQK